MFTKIKKKNKSRFSIVDSRLSKRGISKAHDSKSSNLIRGFTLIELLIYTAGLVMLVGVIVAIIVQLYGLYRQITVLPRADRVGLIVVDRIVKDIRSGRLVDLAQSDLETDDGSLYIESNVSGTTVDKFFDLSDGQIIYQEDGGPISHLSPSDMNVTKFRFDQVNTDISQGVRVEIDITFQNGDETVVKEYQGFAILRHSYE